MEKVLYEELFPDEFAERIKKMPVAFLPLGTRANTRKFSPCSDPLR